MKRIFPLATLLPNFVTFVAACLTLLGPASAHAEAYLGGSVGTASVEASVNGLSFDESDSAKKLIFGYIFDLPIAEEIFANSFTSG